MRIFSLRPMRFKYGLLACAAAAALLLAGCGSSRLNSFTWEVDSVPSNLDPQTASSSSDVIAVTHLFSGLYRLDEQGEPQPDCAESCQVSQDGLTYTFTLKEDLGYNGYRGGDTDAVLTARDFVFGLQRVFLPETNSPWARQLGNIQNGALIAEGKADISQLGVRALDDRTLEIRLEQPDENFLAKLCLPGAMPCNEEYFLSTKGTYGLESDTILGNGPFYLYNWTSEGLFVRRKADGSAINSLRLVLRSSGTAADSGSDSSSSASSASSKTALEKLEDGQVSAALSETPSDGSFSEIPYTATTWVLMYNCQEEGLSSTAVRQGLSASALRTQLELTGSLSPAQGLIPPQVSAEGESYRELAGTILFESDDPLSLYKSGLAQAGLDRLSNLSVLVPEGQTAELFSSINQQWQVELSAFFTVQELPLEEVWQAVESGDYQIALVPLTPSEDDPLNLLQQLAEGQWNGWQNPAFEEACRQESENFTLQGSAARAARLEEQLIVECPVTPLFYETDYLLVDPKVSGLVFQPFGPILDVSGAKQ